MGDWIAVETPTCLAVSQRDGVLRIVFNRPEVLNSFSTESARALLDVLKSARDESVRVVLLTGSGRAFSAGADIDSQFSDESARAVIEKELRELSNPIIVALRGLAKPVISAVNGPAAGIGCSIALASDLVIAAESAFFLLAFANIGLTPDGGASLLVPARIGLGRALALAMLADRVPADQALAWGLADRVVPNDTLAQASEAFAARLAAGPTLSYAASKQAINASMLAGLGAALDREATLQGRLAGTADFLEGTAAFMAKRAPKFEGR